MGPQQKRTENKMEIQRFDLIVIGAGPAGLSAAIEAGQAGMKVIIYDENARPGGQLFKQIHKFFGSKEHKARIRGFRIGEELLEESKKAGVTVQLNATVVGLYDEKELTVRIKDEIVHVKGDSIIVATGAAENVVMFKGWTKPGVIGAGAAQTMMNLYHIKPGHRILMLGSGNVGLVVSYQLVQAGCEVVALVDAAPKIGGYGVHAAKIARLGIPFYLSHTIVEAEGKDGVEGVTIGEVGPDWKVIPGTEKHFAVDTICLAVGLSPMVQLLKMGGCKIVDDKSKGGAVPECDEYGETSIKGIFAAGDVSSIEEASSAMIEGRISGIAAAAELGFLTEEERKEKIEKLETSLDSLRQGMFAKKNRGKPLTQTEEGYTLSQNLLHNGFLTDEEVTGYPGVTIQGKIHPVIECSQNIPCNPCQDVCPKNCITIGKFITSLPVVKADCDCIGCGKCVAACPGQAIFLVNTDFGDNTATVTLPYEFFPLPKAGDKGMACNRKGEKICIAEVVSVRTAKDFDQTNLLTMKVPAEFVDKARFYRNNV
jgi:NADPH-dependent 2,4-dienoyl-CoA reductase/sulfur reductase-like enzyme/Fe-S-cluster-containing hydrogenase component 2